VDIGQLVQKLKSDADSTVFTCAYFLAFRMKRNLRWESAREDVTGNVGELTERRE
jgi:hypothetical protein